MDHLDLSEDDLNILFNASRVWLQTFQARYSVDNRRVSGEAASADTEAATPYPAELAGVIEETG